MEAVDQEADLPAAGREGERLEAVKEAVGARQMQQLRESRRFKYGSLHKPKRQYVADRRVGGWEEEGKGGGG